MVRAVIFDLDDTLHDWPTSIDRALTGVLPDVPGPLRDGLAGRLQRAIEERAYVLRDGVIVNRHHWMLLVDPLPFWQTALPRADSARVEHLSNAFRAALEPVAFSDARPCLEALHGRCPLGLLSNSPSSEGHLAKMGLLGYFDQVVVAEEAHRKPANEAFRRACDAMSVHPTEALYVGDSPASDVEGALAAGLQAIWLDRYGDGYQRPAGVRRIASLDELRPLS